MKIPLPLLKVRAVLAAIILSLAAPLSASAVSGTFAWTVQTLNYPLGVAKMDSAGNMITAYTSNAGGHAVNKYDSTGKLVWSTPIGIFQDVGHILVDGANNVYVDGKDQRSDVTAVVVAKISSNGAILWTNSFPLNFTGGGHTAEHEASGPMAVGNNGSLYVLALGDYSPVIGTVFIGPLNILRINASTGKEQNRIPLGPLTIDTSNPMLNSAIAVDSANNVYYGSPEGLRKYSADLQTVRWTDTQSVVRALVLDAANNIYATGYITNSFGGLDFDARRVNSSDGSVVWIFQSEMPGDPINDGTTDWMCRGGNAIALDSVGQIYAAGALSISGDNIVKLDPSNGNREWTAGQASINAKQADMALAIDAYDNVYVVGTDSEVDPSGKAVVYVYNAGGDLLWNQNYSTANGDVFNNVAVDKNNGVYCIGQDGYIGGANNPALVKYTESGLVVNGKYKIINRNSALAMEVFGAHTNNLTLIDQWAYHTGGNQQWTLTSLGGGQFSIIGVQSGRSLDVPGYLNADGTPIDIYDHNGGANQQFSFTPTSNNYFLIVPQFYPVSCIEGKTFSTTNGTPVDLWHRNGGNNQQWIFQAP